MGWLFVGLFLIIYIILHTIKLRWEERELDKRRKR